MMCVATISPTSSRQLTRVNRGLHSRDVSANHRRHVTATSARVSDVLHFAALTIASEASTIAANERHSIMPSASAMSLLPGVD